MGSVIFNSAVDERKPNENQQMVYLISLSALKHVPMWYTQGLDRLLLEAFNYNYLYSQVCWNC